MKIYVAESSQRYSDQTCEVSLHRDEANDFVGSFR